MSVVATTLRHMDTPPAAAEDPARQVSDVQDGSTGAFLVRTVTGTYLLDLDDRRLLRVPNTIRDGTMSLTWTFDVDGAWLPLVRLRACQVGDFMRATVLVKDVEQSLRSSTVRSIERLPGPPPGRTHPGTKRRHDHRNRRP